MKKRISFIICLFLVSIIVYPQIGINTEDPKATLDVVALPNISTAIDGFLAPRLTGSTLQSKNNLYTSDQIGVVVYVLSTSPGAGIIGDKTVYVAFPGYYSFDGAVWRPLGITIASNGLSALNNHVKLGGTLTGPTTISNITASNNLSFTGTGVNAINFDNNTLSIDATNDRVGIRTASPLRSLDIEGTARFSQNEAINRPGSLQASVKPVYVDQTTGALYYAPNGYTTVSGGFRPGANFLIKKFPITSTIIKVRFVCHINKSNETNNSDAIAYAYGDLTIVGLGSSNPIKFVEVNIKDYRGLPKTLITSNDTTISWNNYTQGITTLTLNQTTGEFRITNTVGVLSYVFEILGGM